METVMLTLLACTGAGLVVGGDDPVADTPDEGGGIEDVGGLEDTDTVTGDPEEPEFFDDSFIHEIAITLSDDAENQLDRDPYTYVMGAITVDGASFPRVGVHLRGKIGSFRDLSGKSKFKIDFNEYDTDQRLGVYKALALNNEVVDCSFEREPTGYALFRQLGLPAPRTAYTNVTVNGEPYGLYVAIEFPDNVFLDGHYDDGDGNLYDGKYAYYNNGSYELIDFTPSQDVNFQLEEGTDVGRVDIRAITEAVVADGTFAERMDPLIDLDEFHRHLVGEQWIGQLDGYALNTNNYRVYFDPTDGRAEFLVYDLDYAFLSASSWGMDWAWPAGVVASDCWTDPECSAAHQAAVASAITTIDTDALLAQMDAWTALIGDAAAADPRKECRRGQIDPDQQYVRAWVAAGSANLAAYWGVE